MKVRDVVKYLEAHGWYFLRSGKGDHRIYAHPTSPHHISIDGHPGADMPERTLRRGVLTPAGLPHPHWQKKAKE